MKCDPCDFEAAFGEVWCSLCLTIYLRSDDDLRTFACKGCNLQHVVENMLDKLEGHYCLACAADYEKNLLEKMTA